MKKALKNSTVIAVLSTVSIIFLIGTAVTFIYNSYYNQRIDTANRKRYSLTSNANLFMSGSSTLTNDVRAYAATGSQEYYDAYWDEVNTVQSRERGLAAMQEIGITREEQDLIDQMASISNNLVPLEEQAMQVAKAGNKTAAVAYVYGEEYTTSINQINQLKSQFLEHLDSRTTNEIAELKSVCSTLNTTVWIIICITIVLQLISSVYNHRKIIRPVTIIERQMREIAAGNLHCEFHLVPDTSEIGILVDAIHRTKATLKEYVEDISDRLSGMAAGNMNQTIALEYIGDFRPIQNALTTIFDSLNHILGEVLNSSDLVARHANQVASGAQDLSQGTTQQAASLQEISATVNNLSGRMEKVAQNAQNAKSVSDHSTDALNLCNQKMSDLIEAMGQISDASSEINNIISTIENIAFQTNILALNAAVESARVGEVGKGFAVVADEVRSLANQSQEASQNTSLLIAHVLEAIENGIQIADDTARTLVQVVDGARQTTDYVDNIADASNEQSHALQQLTIGVNQISDVVQNTSAISEESAAASAELNEQAATMNRLISSFTLRT